MSIVVIAEHADGKVRPVTYELAAFASRLKNAIPSFEIEIVVMGDAVEELSRTIAGRTGIDVLAVSIPGAACYSAEIYTSVLTKVLKDLRPAYVCTAHSARGLDFAPGLAVRLGAACITGVESMTVSDGTVRFRRSICGGKIVADMRADSPTTVLCVLPGAYSLSMEDAGKPGSVRIQTMPFTSSKTFPLGVLRKWTDTSAVSEADVVVAAGRGIGDKERLELIYRLAALFPGSAVAGSRIICDNGWLDYAQQVGVTGCTVSPSLYIACGISGAVQHVSGMRGSGFIVAINTDPGAAIFNVSDVCIVEDLNTFIPIFIEAYEMRTAEKTEAI